MSWSITDKLLRLFHSSFLSTIQVRSINVHTFLCAHVHSLMCKVCSSVYLQFHTWFKDSRHCISSGQTPKCRGYIYVWVISSKRAWKMQVTLYIRQRWRYSTRYKVRSRLKFLTYARLCSRYTQQPADVGRHLASSSCVFVPGSPCTLLSL